MRRWRNIASLGCAAFLAACVSGTTPVLDAPLSDSAAADANVNLGAEYLRRGRPNVALEVLRRALEIEPRHAAAHLAIALAYGELGEHELAETHHRRALRFDSRSPEAQNAYAVFLCRQNRWPEAEPLFRQAADNPDYATPEAALTNAGTCARNAGEPESARNYYLEALSVDPGYPDALANMVDIAWRNRDYVEARSWVQRSLTARPGNARLLLLCVRIERQLGDPQAADRCAARLRDDFPESAESAQIRLDSELSHD